MRKTAIVFCILALMGLFMSPGTVPMADAANLKARSATIDPATGYPTWYQDNNNLALTLCLDQNGFCILPGAFTPPATKAGINAANFPVEAFYALADNAFDFTGGNMIYRAGLESGFAAAVVDGGQAVFTRIRIRANVSAIGTYTVTHPFGSKTFDVAAIVPGFEINDTIDVPGLVAGAFDTALISDYGPFLTQSNGSFITDPATGNRYIGNPLTPVTVTGSPLGNNFVQITGPGIGPAPDGVSNQFTISGKIIGMDVAPSSNVDLGPIIMLTPTLPKTVTVTNTTGNPITFGPLALAGADALDFAITPPAAPALDCSNKTLTAAAPGNSCSFNVAFTPNAAAKGVRTATIALAPTTVQPAPPAPAVDNPPPVTMNLSGTALVNVSATAGAHGSITPVVAAGLPAGTAPAGSAVTFTVTPSNSKFKVRDVLDGTTTVAGPTFTINTGAVDHTVTASFMPSGNLTGSGTPGVADAVKALRIAVGLVTPTDEDKLAMDVAPLGADGRPAGDQVQDLRDVLLILRRVIGVVTW